jgi:hypothetical protein
VLNTILRILLAIWVAGFLLISCAPLYAEGGVGVLGFLSGAVLLVPWLIGVVILGVLIWLTNPKVLR